MLTNLLPIEIAAALVAAIPGIATVYLARQLNRMEAQRDQRDAAAAAANYRLALFRMRIEVFEAVQDYLADFVAEGRPTVQAAVQLRRHSRKARFLFPAEVQGFVAELAGNAFAYQRAYLIWEPFRAKSATGQPLSEEEAKTRDACLAEMRAIRDWIAEVWESGRHLREFERFLILPETLS